MDWQLEDVLKAGLVNAQRQTEETSQFLAIVERVAHLTHRGSPRDQVCKELVQIVVEETDMDNASILLWNPSQCRLALVAAYGIEDLLEVDPLPNYHKGLSFAPGEGVAGQVYVNQKPVFIDDTSKSPIPCVYNALIRPVSLAVLPILDLGILNLSCLRSHPFSCQSKRNWELLTTTIGYLLLGRDSNASGQELDANRSPLPSPEELYRPLRERKHLAELALARSPQGICLLDNQGNTIEINETFERLLGANATNVIGASPSVFFADPRIWEKLFEKLSGADYAATAGASLLRSDGQAFTADTYLAKFANRAGNLTGYVLSINDISDRVITLEKQVHKEKIAALGAMAQGVAHNFNNLLAAILGHIELIVPKVSDSEVLQRLERIEMAINDGARTVRRLQKFTTKEKWTQASDKSTDVCQAISEAVELTRPHWKDAMEREGHKVELAVEQEPRCFAAIQASDLKEVLSCMILNALEAMPAGGKLTLKFYSRERDTLIEIADTGIGMGEEVRERVFDPFFTTKGLRSSGLGLSISWGLVAQYGGTIHVKSTLGKGSVFTITIPRTEAPRRGATSSNQGERSIPGTILLAYDDPEPLGLIGDMLRLKGYNVVTACRAEEALPLIEQTRCDLILSDHGLPDSSGPDLAKRAKSKRPGIPVIMIDGWGGQPGEEDSMNEVVDVVLPKPVSWNKLLDTIEKALASS